MEIKEAIQYITHHAFISDDVKDMAIEALEKQISYEVVNEGDKFEGYGICKCGGCAVDQFSMLYNYCPKCGQKLDWSEEE